MLLANAMHAYGHGSCMYVMYKVRIHYKRYTFQLKYFRLIFNYFFTILAQVGTYNLYHAHTLHVDVLKHVFLFLFIFNFFYTGIGLDSNSRAYRIPTTYSSRGSGSGIWSDIYLLDEIFLFLFLIPSEFESFANLLADHGGDAYVCMSKPLHHPSSLQCRPPSKVYP